MKSLYSCSALSLAYPYFCCKSPRSFSLFPSTWSTRMLVHRPHMETCGDQRGPLSDDDERADGTSVEPQMARTVLAVHLRILGSRILFPRKWSRATQQFFRFR